MNPTPPNANTPVLARLFTVAESVSCACPTLQSMTSRTAAKLFTAPSPLVSLPHPGNLPCRLQSLTSEVPDLFRISTRLNQRRVRLPDPLRLVPAILQSTPRHSRFGNRQNRIPASPCIQQRYFAVSYQPRALPHACRNHQLHVLAGRQIRPEGENSGAAVGQ